MLSSGHCGPETVELKRLTWGPAWFRHTAGFSLQDLKGGGGGWRSLVVMIWAPRPGSGCRRLECMILPLATCVYLISVPAALQPFTVVLTHQHSDCNRMLVLRGPCMPAPPPWLLSLAAVACLVPQGQAPGEEVGEVQRWVEVDPGSGRGM